jgi:hypothetical protein
MDSVQDCDSYINIPSSETYVFQESLTFHCPKHTRQQSTN